MNIIEQRKQMRGQGGFTLIELLVVIAILAVLGGAAIIGISTMRDNAEDQVCKTDKKTVETAAEAWALEPGVTPASTDVANLISEGYLKDNDIDTRYDDVTYSATAGFTAVGIGTCV